MATVYTIAFSVGATNKIATRKQRPAAADFFYERMYDAVAAFGKLDNKSAVEAMNAAMDKIEDGAAFVKFTVPTTDKTVIFEKVSTVKKNPKRKTAKRKTVKRKTKRKASPAQLRARKLFAQRAKAGTLRKNPKRKTAKRKAPAKRKAVKTKTRKCVTRKARTPRKKVLKVNPTRKRAAGKTWVIRGTQKTRTGYLHYYLHGDRFLSALSGANKFTKAGGEAKMHAIIDKLPMQISRITLEKLRASR